MARTSSLRRSFLIACGPFKVVALLYSFISIERSFHQGSTLQKLSSTSYTHLLNNDSTHIYLSHAVGLLLKQHIAVDIVRGHTSPSPLSHIILRVVEM